ncbi:alpha/beta hydrolase [Salinispora oceanensis]|uniref:alpha/beta hydrolase n=1 Tax=Salinispora oceanensis TaxID=1050199 RepID=UPI00037F38D7|nr:alpha/beta hydrolase [Salinispora oceanensis]
MSDLTLRDVLDFRPDPWHESAQVWGRLAQGIDDAAEQLIRGSRDLVHVWPAGRASAAAVGKGEALRAEVSNVYNPARRVADALEQHAYAMLGLRRQAEEIVAAARVAGYQVDMVTGATAPPPSADMAGGLDRSSRATESVLRYLPTVVEYARAQDDATANAIAVNGPSPRVGFGTGRLGGVSRGVLEAQAGRSPAEVHAWWESLTPLQQEQALREFPDLVGQLDGVPVSDRDVANRTVLERQSDLLQQAFRAANEHPYDHELLPADTRLLLERGRAELASKLRGIDAITSRLNDPNRPEAYLIGFSSDGDGRAIVSVGNPDTAENVLTYVPGTGEQLSSAGGGLKRMDAMAQDAAWAAGGEKTSVVYWYGYDAPDLISDAGGESYAEGGGPVLDRFQSGLRATHDGEGPSRNTVLGHSYGSTVIGHAARDSDFDADAVVFVGSPGVGVDHASELTGVRPDQVWATTAKHDVIGLVPDWGFTHGKDPSEADFGARVFRSDSGSFLDMAGAHSAYWEESNPARTNIAEIVTGQAE